MNLFLSLIRNDFKQEFAGSFFGGVWAFVQPIVTILIFWFVFQVGFKAQPVGDYPFILWLLSGMIPWFFFNEGVSKATQSIVANSYLVKKIVFKVSLLPIIKIVTALFIHIFFLMVMVIIYMAYGYGVNIYYIQIVYYLFSLTILMYGISLITSTFAVFAKDINPLVTMLLQFGFWITPIFWNLDTVPKKYHMIIELNPLVYIINGYRDVFINKVWFWEHNNMTIFFWMITGILLVVGRVTYKYLRPSFADVL
ncbi:ABC transporter permease [Sulfurovum sp. XTW-4]|uniref:Transport permease protein n=1 Tax=Sulfurovum xiamenensis TaxID=3019066 RepID=A0ABT7QQN1_9BACT|nr:ABC transporter permease [Sulfurovum xiamenensis]MDM5263077.1 ABC transporter permease [Sulfurovum xiamenensis]